MDREREAKKEQERRAEWEKNPRSFTVVLRVAGEPDVNNVVYPESALRSAVENFQKRTEPMLCVMDPAITGLPPLIRTSHEVKAMRVEEREGKPSLVADIELIDAPDGWVLGMVLDKGHFGITCYATPVEPAEEIVEDLELAEWDLDTGKKKYKPGGVIEVKDDVEITNVPFIMDRKRDKE